MVNLQKDVNRAYTGANVDGVVTLETDILSSITLASTDLTLNANQVKPGIFEVTTGSATYSIIIPTSLAVPGKLYIISNTDGVNSVLIKVAGGTPVTIAASKTAIVRVNSTGTQIIRVTLDS